MGDTNEFTKISGIYFLYLFRYYHKVKSRLVINKNFAVSIVDKSPWRILGNVPQHIIIGRELVGIVNDLNIKKTAKKDKPDSYKN